MPKKRTKCFGLLVKICMNINCITIRREFIQICVFTSVVSKVKVVATSSHSNHKQGLASFLIISDEKIPIKPRNEHGVKVQSF